MHFSSARGILILLVATAIWGSTFAVLKGLNEGLSPALIVAGRFWVAALLLLPIVLLSRQWPKVWGKLIADGAIIAFWLILGYGTQTIALQTTTANRAAFFTALSVVIIPLWLLLVAKRPQSPLIWWALPLAVGGLALISWEGGAWVVGDAWAIACALSYAAFIIVLEKRAVGCNILWLTFVQVVWVAIFATLWAVLSGHHFGEVGRIFEAAQWWPLVYLGVVATALTTLLQTWGQKLVNAAQASLVYSLEPVFAAVFSLVLLGERLSTQGMLGAALIVTALMLSSAAPPQHIRPPQADPAILPDVGPDANPDDTALQR